MSCIRFFRRHNIDQLPKQLQVPAIDENDKLIEERVWRIITYN